MQSYSADLVISDCRHACGPARDR